MRGTTLPELAKTELVEAFLEARMPMPTDVQGWKLLERQIADAISQIFTLHGLRSGCSTLLKEPVSLLLRDRRERDYEFTAFVSDSGEQRASRPHNPPRRRAHARRSLQRVPSVVTARGAQVAGILPISTAVGCVQGACMRSCGCPSVQTGGCGSRGMETASLRRGRCATRAPNA